MIKNFFFFFQAEDGIRDDLVTGVQTCALPIYLMVGMAFLHMFRVFYTNAYKKGSFKKSWRPFNWVLGVEIGRASCRERV